MKLIRRLYQIAHYFLWAFLAVWVFYAVLLVVNYRQLYAAQLHERMDQLADESDTYCSRWGFKPGTHDYNLCVLDLDQIRENERQRLLADFQ